jgi:hypothetical protein
MGNPTNYSRIGGESVRVGDCWVWAEIKYLDSPTDYREFLPQSAVRWRHTSGDDLVMLDPSSYPKPRARPWGLWPALLFVPMIVWFLLKLAESW